VLVWIGAAPQSVTNWFQSIIILNYHYNHIERKALDEFCIKVQALIDSKFASRREFVRRAYPDDDENTAQAYVGMVLNGKRPAPIDRIQDWARVLDLSPEDRQWFFRDAIGTHRKNPLFPLLMASLDAAPDAYIAHNGVMQFIVELKRPVSAPTARAADAIDDAAAAETAAFLDSREERPAETRRPG
jgi:hypothetical protein